MFKPDRLAERAGAILFERIDQRLESLLAEHGASDPGELSPAQMNEVFQRAIGEAAGCFPTANLEQLAHGFRSFVHPAFMPAWDRVKSAAAIGGDSFAFSSGADAAVLLAGFGLAVAPFDFSTAFMRSRRTISIQSSPCSPVQDRHWLVTAVAKRHFTSY
jgi:hypothetical protein